MAESEQVQEHGAGAESRRRPAREDRDMGLPEEQQEAPRKGFLRHVFEFFIRLLGIGNKRDKEKAQQRGQDQPQGEQRAQVGPGGKSNGKGPGSRGPSHAGQTRAASAHHDAPDAAPGGGVSGASRGIQGAGGLSGGVAAHRDLLEAAKKAGPADPESLMGMAKPAADSPSTDNAPVSLVAMRGRAEAVFAAHGEEMKSRIVADASTEDRPVYDHSRPSSLDMDLIDRQLADLLQCKGDRPTREELISTYYGACMMGKLHQLQASEDTSLVDQDPEAVMNSYLSEVDNEVAKIQHLDIPEEQRAKSRDEIIERLKTVYADISPKGHGTLEDRVLARAAKADEAGQQRKQQQDFSM